MSESKIEESSMVLSRDFDWISYLETFNEEASPESAFIHVETSLDSGVRAGMIVERPLDDIKSGHDAVKVFWLARIDSVFGPLLKLSWLGDQSQQEIWHDLHQERLYPLGYCQMNKFKNLNRPKELWKIAQRGNLWL